MSQPDSHRSVLRRRQLAALTRQELGRSLLSRRALIVYVMVSLPVLVTFLRIPFMTQHERADLPGTTTFFAFLFYLLMLRLLVFFGCAGLFIRAFRGEIMDQSLHYHLLAPVRRDLLVVGKYLGALITALIAFVLMTGATWVLAYLPHGLGRTWQYVVSGGGGSQLFSYMTVVVLGCVGYGATFLLFGLLFRNPMVPTALLMGWEALVPFLPPMLKKVSIIQHLTSLCPLPLAQGPFAVLADPTPAWAAVLGLLVVSSVLLWLSCRVARGLEITYSAD